MSQVSSVDFRRYLEQTALFAGITAEDLAILATAITPRQLPPQTLLFRLGDLGEEMYLICEGRVRIFLPDVPTDLTLAEYGAMEIVGEFAIFDQLPRSASAMTLESTLVLSLSKPDLIHFLEHHPQASFAMMQNLAHRARYTTRYLEEVTKWAQRLAQGDYERAVQEIAAVSPTGHDPIAALVATFLQMVRQVQAREAEYERKLRLKIQIDDEQRQADFKRVVGSGLLDKARQMKAEFQDMVGQGK